MDNITRICRKCGQELPLSEFAKNKTCELGYSYTCKQCKREYYRRYRAANPEKCRERNRKYHAANLEKERERHRKWDAENAEKRRKYYRKRYAANPEKARERSRKWYAANPEKARERSRKWREANLEKHRELCRKKNMNNCEALTDYYLRDKLRRNNLPITPETIDYKRIQLKLYREIKKQQNDERD